MNRMIRRAARSLCSVSFLGLLFLFSSPGAHAKETRVHLKVVDWNTPAGTRIRATVRSKLKVLYVNRSGSSSKGKGGGASLESLIDDFAPETLHWEVVTKEGQKASKEMDFAFPVELGELNHGVTGEVFDVEFEIAEPDGTDGEWKVERADHTELGLFLDGPQLKNPTACIRFIKEASGYGVGIAYECTDESFAKVQAESSPCPTCDAKNGGN